MTRLLVLMALTLLAEGCAHAQPLVIPLVPIKVVPEPCDFNREQPRSLYHEDRCDERRL